MKTKAIILASGVGKRLRPLTNKTPKSLISFGGVTILERIIQSLIDNKVTDIIITTGHLEREVKKFLRNKYQRINITYVRNPIYDKTNYIYSLWLAREVSKNADIILLHGDLVYASRLMEMIVKKDKSCVLVKRKGRVPRKDFKARIKNGLITEIGVNVTGSGARFCLPLYKFLRKDFKKLIREVGKLVKADKLNCYAEDAFNQISNQVKMRPLYYNKEFCMEIDNLNDLEKAKKIFKNIINSKK